MASLMDNLSSSRLELRLKGESCASLPDSFRAFAVNSSQSDQWDDEDEEMFPSLIVSPAVDQRQDEPELLLSLQDSPSGCFQGEERFA